MRDEVLKKILRAQDHKIPIALITRLSDGSQAVVDRKKSIDGDMTFSQQELEEVLSCIRDDKSRSLGGGEYKA